MYLLLPSANLLCDGYSLEPRTKFATSRPITACHSASKRREHLFLESLARLYGIFTPPDPKIPTSGDPPKSLKSRWAPTEDGSEHLCGERRCLCRATFPPGRTQRQERGIGASIPSHPTAFPPRPRISEADFRHLRLCSVKAPK